jgi:hypothetical protein
LFFRGRELIENCLEQLGGVVGKEIGLRGIVGVCGGIEGFIGYDTF